VNPIGIRSCYDEGKRCAETLFFDYHRQLGLRIKVARIFNTYGPRMHPNDGRVVSNFIVQALCNEPLTIYGGGEQTRSFCYVDDLIEGFVRLMQTRTPSPARSISAIPASSRWPSWPAWCSSSPAPGPRSATCRCRRTTRCAASPTSHSPARPSTGAAHAARRGAPAHDRVLRGLPAPARPARAQPGALGA